VAAILPDILKESSHDEDPPPFLLFDLAPRRVPLNDCVSLLPSKMSPDRFDRLSKQLFMGAPACLTEAEAVKVTSYSGRRLYPTLAEMLRFSADERVKLGGWLDAEAVETKKRGAIADTYADRKLETSLLLKREVAQAIRLSIHAIGKSAATLQWPDIIQRCATRKVVRANIAANLDIPAQGGSLLKVKKFPNQASDTSSSSSNTDASSSSSADSEDSASEQTARPVCWLKASQGAGRLHLLSAKSKASQGKDAEVCSKQTISTKCTCLLGCVIVFNVLNDSIGHSVLQVPSF
jgi:hypothetical protein